MRRKNLNRLRSRKFKEGLVQRKRCVPKHDYLSRVYRGDRKEMGRILETPPSTEGALYLSTSSPALPYLLLEEKALSPSPTDHIQIDDSTVLCYNQIRRVVEK